MNNRKFKKELKKSIIKSIGMVFEEENYKYTFSKKSKKVYFRHDYTKDVYLICENNIKTCDVKLHLYDSKCALWGVSTVMSQNNFSINTKSNSKVLCKLIRNTIKSLLYMLLADKKTYLDKQVNSEKRKNKIETLLCSSPLES